MIKIYFFALSFLLSTKLLAATKVHVEEARVYGTDDNKVISELVGDLIKQNLREQNEFKLARSIDKASYVVSTKLISNEGLYILSLKAKGFRPSHSTTEIIEFRSLSELGDHIDDAMEVALIEQAENSEEEFDYQPTMASQIKSKNRSPEGFWFWGMGPAKPHGLHLESYSQWTFGYAWLFEDQMFRLELESSSPSDDESDTLLTGFGFSGLQFLNSGKSRLFVSGTLQNASLSLDRAHSEGEFEVDGYIAGGGVGVMFWATTDLLIEASLYSRTMLAKVDGATPGVTGFKVAVYW